MRAEVCAPEANVAQLCNCGPVLVMDASRVVMDPLAEIEAASSREYFLAARVVAWDDLAIPEDLELWSVARRAEARARRRGVHSHVANGAAWALQV